jgi:hypothetical protein
MHRTTMFALDEVQLVQPDVALEEKERYVRS